MLKENLPKNAPVHDGEKILPNSLPENAVSPYEMYNKGLQPVRLTSK